ncbi:hypothetical protein RF11_02791 [Thelohanellus kitauei]|uniref:MD-2-related lipid-recognition domain-containing protein n=1 Tax=Thelohanellus kitauei TaxID=669202 RepID=A0A0C2MRK4_THEKT|nr:hypothetical protein RF11_02791 [Thelohanellus kitauei]
MIISWAIVRRDHLRLMRGLSMRISGVQSLMFLMVIGSVLRLSSQQIYQCTLPIGDADFVVESVSMTGCSYDACKHRGKQTFNVSFTVLIPAKTIQISVVDNRKADKPHSVKFWENYKVCDDKDMECPVMPGTTLSLSFNISIPKAVKNKDIWTRVEAFNENKERLLCLKILSAKKGQAPKKPDL